MKRLQRLELLKDFVQEAVDRGASSVEQIHQHIAGLPFEVLEKSGLLDDDKLKLRERQRRTIGAVYDAIRRVNREIGQLISDQFENVEETQHVGEVLSEKAEVDEAPAPKPAAKKRKPKAGKSRSS
ncbi:MAG: hypothetical protein P4L83_18785 [Nevskia sp.]|nr:hypothetical protein [Nevskia sp.]